jgi:FixJ family two-component response regulator
MQPEPTIFAVDDDAAITSTIVQLGKLIGLRVETYASAQEFLVSFDPSRPGCLVLDVRMPGMSGLELQRRLLSDGIKMPIIMLSGHADVPMAVDAMATGALTFLEKPFRVQVLCDHIQRAIRLDVENRTIQESRIDLENRLSSLTDKEREVVELLIVGKTNKAIAAELGLGRRAVEDRRARVMKKLNLRTVAELVELVAATRAV